MNKDMRVGTRLAIGFGMVILLLIGITWLGIARMGALNALNALNGSTRLIVHDRYPKVVAANHLLIEISEAAILMRNLLLDEPEKRRSTLDSLLENRRRVTENLAMLDQTLSTMGIARKVSYDTTFRSVATRD